MSSQVEKYLVEEKSEQKKRRNALTMDEMFHLLRKLVMQMREQKSRLHLEASELKKGAFQTEKTYKAVGISEAENMLMNFITRYGEHFTSDNINEQMKKEYKEIKQTIDRFSREALCNDLCSEKKCKYEGWQYDGIGCRCINESELTDIHEKISSVEIQTNENQ